VRCWESLRCSFTPSSLPPSNCSERPGAVDRIDRAVAIASASQILVTAHLRYAQGMSAVLPVLSFKPLPVCVPKGCPSDFTPPKIALPRAAPRNESNSI